MSRSRERPSRLTFYGRMARQGLGVAARTFLWAQLSMVAASLILAGAYGFHAPLVIEGGSMSPAVGIGDVVVLDTPSGDEDLDRALVAFETDGRTVTHRVVAERPDGTLVTKGDANARSDSTPLHRGDVIGRVRVVIPYVGLPISWLREHDWLRLAGWCAVTGVAARIGSTALVDTARRNPPCPARHVDDRGTSMSGSESARRGGGSGRFHRGTVVAMTLGLVMVGTTHSFRVSNAEFAGSTGTAGSFTAGAWKPVTAGLVWWLGASSPGTLFSDDSCSTGATPGGEVRCWRDVRPGHDEITTSGTPMTWTTSTINGLAPVRVDNAGELRGPDLLNSPADIQLFVVVRENARVPDWTLSLHGTNNGANNRWSMHLPWSNGCYYFDPGDATQNRASVCNVTNVGDATLVDAYKDSSAGHNGLRINRGTGALSSGYSAASTSGGLRIGYIDNAPNIDYAELLIYDRRLSTSEQAQVESYLRIKWATP
ncbi:MAG: S24/S26 family peptidase [Microthrixaceae bacterium]